MILNPEAVGNPNMEPIVVVLDEEDPDAVRATHVHLDHIGELHALIEQNHHDAGHDRPFGICNHPLCETAHDNAHLRP